MRPLIASRSALAFSARCCAAATPLSFTLTSSSLEVTSASALATYTCMVFEVCWHLSTGTPK
jgi:hypothetical protein